MARSKKAEGTKQRARGKKDEAASSTPTPANDDAKRELFLHHRSQWIGYQAKLKAAENIGDDVKKALKKDGFTIQEFKIADELATQRGEIKIKSEVSTRLRVARWIGHPMGKQLDLFAETTTAVADPYDEGKQASMENQPRKPPSQYAEFSDNYEKWMNGYSEHQAVLAGNFRKSADPKPEADRTPGPVGDQPSTHETAH